MPGKNYLAFAVVISSACVLCASGIKSCKRRHPASHFRAPRSLVRPGGSAPRKRSPRSVGERNPCASPLCRAAAHLTSGDRDRTLVWPDSSESPAPCRALPRRLTAESAGSRTVPAYRSVVVCETLRRDIDFRATRQFSGSPSLQSRRGGWARRGRRECKDLEKF